MKPAALLVLMLCLLAAPGAAQGQDAGTAAPHDEERASEVQYGVGLRFRGLFVPRSAFEYFVEVAPSGVAQPEVGLEVIRRKGRFETALALAWAPLSPKDGVWLDEPDHNPSLVEFDGFAWLSLDLTGVWAYPFDEYLALRYGMGIGVGVLLGTVRETDYECPDGRIDVRVCRQSPTAEDVRKRIDMPPVVPVVNAVLGLRYAPSPQVAFNFDGGLQTAFFAGLSVDIFFK